MGTSICLEGECAGCEACVNVCPKNCIHMFPDNEGFLRPEIFDEVCDHCGACRRVCPVLNSSRPSPLAAPRVFACWNKDEEIRFQSASGGAFSAFAQNVLNDGGVVFGAAFDRDMNLIHIAVERSEQLYKLRSSKYVQSKIGFCYREVQVLLNQGRKVLFSGTPCQVAALSRYLGKQYDNLIMCDMLCHGVPSPGLFARYIEYLHTRLGGSLENINVRHKRKGWRLASTVAFFRDGREKVLRGVLNSFMFGFIKGFILRPACYLCPYTTIDRRGDITLADFWGIGEIIPFRHNTRNGISLIFVNSDKGLTFFNNSSNLIYFEERSLEEAKYKRPKLKQPLSRPKIRKQFFDDYKKYDYETLAKKYLVDKGVKGFIKKIFPRLLLFTLKNLFKKLRSRPFIQGRL